MDRDELRQYFANKGLNYQKIRLKDLNVLEAMCNKEFSLQYADRIKNNETVYWIGVNPAKYYKGHYTENGMIDAYLTARGGYFTREVVSFKENGVISFCLGTDGCNINPAANAFIEWCDWLAVRQ